MVVFMLFVLREGAPAKLLHARREASGRYLWTQASEPARVESRDVNSWEMSSDFLC